MSYNIKLYVHGVPNGQDIWGNPSVDKIYIESFYRLDVCPPQLLLEVKQFESEMNSYYTYLSYGTLDSSGRPGGYFALTLRVNYYYRDIKNIYNLLEAAFNKFIIGNILEKNTNGVYKFKVSAFKEVDDSLKSLEKELQNYLMQFSRNEDFVKLDGFNHASADRGKICLLDAVPDVVEKYVRSKGSISVSPQYQSSKDRQFEATKKQEIENAVNVKDQEITSIRSKCETADSENKQLRSKVKELDEEIDRLRKIEIQLGEKLQEAESSKKESDKENDDYRKMKSLLDDISQYAMSLGVGGKQDRSPKGHKRDDNDSHKTDSVWRVIHKIHPITELVVMAILMVIIGFSLPKCHFGVGNLKGTNIGMPPAEQEYGEDTIPPAAPEISNPVELKPLTDSWPKAKIDIEGISHQRPMQYDGYSSYTISLIGVDSDQINGRWESDDFDIVDDNKIKPKRKGQCTIRYVVDNYELSRTIDVQ